jgi:hypothetical protein
VALHLEIGVETGLGKDGREGLDRDAGFGGGALRAGFGWLERGRGKRVGEEQGRTKGRGVRARSDGEQGRFDVR